jgi:NAD(P)-dependent dehydrogenase (short-subunit alcohol dehydrogenase family)
VVEAAGRTALITGGAQGLGAAIAERFLSEGFARVVLVDRNADKLKETAARLGPRAHMRAGDLMDASLPPRAVAHAGGVAGRLDVLVNAAGSTERCGLEDTTPEAFERLFSINVRAPLFMMQEAAKLMTAQRSGIIINVASMLAHGGPPNLATYSASKSALITLSKNAANTWKRQGIRCYVINLGWALTEGEHALQTGFHKMPADWADAIGARMPAGRLILPSDIADLCAYLITPSAAMMNGAAIDFEQVPTGVFESHPALAPE